MAFESSFKILSENLDEQIRVYRSLLEIVRRERDILKSVNLDDLNENNRSKEAHLVKLRSLENARLIAAKDLAQIINVAEEQSSLLAIAKLLPAPESDKLRSQHSVLSLMLKRVQEFNKQNETLVNSALEKITGAMRAIRDTLQESPTYRKGGERTAVPGTSGHLVRKEV